MCRLVFDAKSSVGTNIGRENFLDCCQVNLAFRKDNPVQTRPTCHPYALSRREAIGAEAKPEDVGLFARRVTCT